jgi:hypothetical protein
MMLHDILGTEIDLAIKLSNLIICHEGQVDEDV